MRKNIRQCERVSCSRKTPWIDTRYGRRGSPVTAKHFPSPNAAVVGSSVPCSFFPDVDTLWPWPVSRCVFISGDSWIANHNISSLSVCIFVGDFTCCIYTGSLHKKLREREGKRERESGYRLLSKMRKKENAKYCFSCARSHPQRLLEGKLFKTGTRNVSDLPLPVAHVKNTNSLEKTNKNHKGISSTVMVFVAAFISTNRFMSNSDFSLQYAVPGLKWFQFITLVNCSVFKNWASHKVLLSGHEQHCSHEANVGEILISHYFFFSSWNLIVSLQHVLILQIPADARFPPPPPWHIRIRERHMYTSSASNAEMSCQKKCCDGIIKSPPPWDDVHFCS